jgi:all-trans-retinol dehydrogenase (NAD+)
MIERKRGHIVAISSMCGLQPAARAITYSATKSAIKALMISLQDELDADGLDSFIDTTTMYPWFINTRKETIDNIVNKLP